jgi:ribosomal protein S12 methylthiotransferase accessory factor
MADDHAIEWCPAWSLTRGRAVLVPAAFVFANATNDVLPEWTSTGLASHVCLTRAVLGGLCEVLERDALAVTWYNALATTPLSPAGTPLERLLDSLDRDVGVTVRLMALPTDSPFPVVLALARGYATPPFAAVGVACRANLAMAASKAVAECIQVMVRVKPGGDDSDLDDDPAARYATLEGAELLESCLQTAEEAVAHCTESSPRSPSAELNAGVEQLHRQGFEVLVAELTTVDVAQAGWHVVRVIVPGMLWPGTRPEMAPLGARRLYHLPVDLGLRSFPLSECKLRSLPVPLS